MDVYKASLFVLLLLLGGLFVHFLTVEISVMSNSIILSYFF